MAWFGNIYQKFENMIIEVESTIIEETVQCLENQIQIVGESVRNFYSEVMEDLIPPSSCSAPVLPIAHCAGAGISNSNKSFRVSKKITAKADTKQSTKDSSINRDLGNFVEANNLGNFVEANNFISCARPHVCSADIKSNVFSAEKQQNRKMSASNTATEVTLSETDVCGSSQSCEISDANQNDEATVSKTGSAESIKFASVGDCCNEIEKASTEQNHGVPVSVEPDEEKNMSSFSSDIFEDQHGYSMVKAMQPEDCSHGTIIVSHPDIDVTIEQDHKTTRQDNSSNLDETCVMITRDELPLVSNATVNIKTSEKKWLQPFSLSKKSTRKQEYEELALKHRNNENGKGDRVESLCQTLPEDVSEPEWEFLEVPR